MNFKKAFSRIKDKMRLVKKDNSVLLENKKMEKVLDSGVNEVVADEQKAVSLGSISTSFKFGLGLVFALTFAYFVYQINSILVTFLGAFLLAAALDPLIDYLQSKRVPRALGLLIVYLVIFTVVGFLFAQILPLLAKQLVDIASIVSDFVFKLSNRDYSNTFLGPMIKPFMEKYGAVLDFKELAVQLKKYLEMASSQLLNLGGNIWNIVLAISNGLMNLLLILILVFFMTVDEKAVENMCLSVFPEKYTNYISMKMEMIKISIGHWIRGQVNVSLLCGILTYVGLVLMGVDYALTLSVIVAIMMIVPVFGRVFAWFFSLPIVFSQSPTAALILSVYYFVLSQVENNFLIPYFMNRAVGLSPVIIMFALLVGNQFLGIVGLMIAVPVATIVSLFIKDFTRKLS